MDLFDLYAKISLDDSKYNAGIANATKSGKELSQKFATSYTKGFETFAKTAAKAVTVVGGAVATLEAIGLNYNSQMESYTTNFEVMLGSTEKAAAKVEELKTMAAKTPFGMADLADATQTLLAFQVPAEQSTDILRMLGDVALGDKEKMKGLALVFGQVSSAGKLQGQDLLQMINQGFNPLNYISQRTGESMEELRDRMSAGAISAEEVTQAFKDATSAGGQFYQGMDKASTTTAGLISTLKDSGKELSQKFATSYTKGFETFAKTAAKAITVVGGAVATLGAIGLNYNSQMESYTTNFEVMLGSTEKAVAKVEELKTMAAKTPFGMEDLASATQTLIAFQVPAEQSTDILSMLGDVALGDKNKLAGLATVFGQVSSAGKLQGQDLMQMINQGFNPLNYISQRTGESMEELRDRMSEGAISAEEVTQAFKDATSEGGQFYQGMEKASTTTAGLISTLKDLANSKLGELFSTVSDKLTEILPSVIEFVDSFDVQAIIDKVEDIIDMFEKWAPLIVAVVTAFTTLYAIFKAMQIVESIKTAFIAFNAVLAANPFILIATIIATVIAALITLWNTNEDFRNAVTSIWEGIKSAFSSAVDFIVELFTVKIPQAFNAVVDFIKSIPEKIIMFGLDLYFAGLTFIKNLISAIGAGFAELYGKVVSAIKQYIIQPIVNAANEAKEAGKKILQKLWDGIKEVWTKISDWFKGVWNSLFGGLSVDVNANVSGNVSKPNAGGATIQGSYASGLDYVPYDGFVAELHKGETILTASDAAAYRSGAGATINVYAKTLNRADIDYLLQIFNAKMGAMA